MLDLLPKSCWRWKIRIQAKYDYLRRKSYKQLQILRWFFPVFSSLFQSPKSEKKRILIIYDLVSQPFSIGDVLLMQEASLILREQYRADWVDFAIVYNSDDPVPSDSAFKSISAENFMFNLPVILSVAQVNRYLGSVMAFNSHTQLHDYICSQVEQAYIWPSGWKNQITQEYLNYTFFDELVYPYYQQYGAIPNLTCRAVMEKWAMEFYLQHAKGLVPVTINLRNNPAFDIERNANMDLWIDFFKGCEAEYDATFFVICSAVEVDARLRTCKNVIVVKDFNTGIEQDLALIQMSAMHLGAISGPATVAWFSQKPYLNVKASRNWIGFKNPGLILQEAENVMRFCFAAPHQKILIGDDSEVLLKPYFKEMWPAIDPNLWSSESLLKAAQTSEEAVLRSWLR